MLFRRLFFASLVLGILCFLVYLNYEKATALRPNSKRSTQDPSLIDGMDRFVFYRKHLGNKTIKHATKVSLLYAYEYDFEISVSLTSRSLHGYKLFCRYLDIQGHEIGRPYESFTHPEYTVNCPKREGTNRIGLSVEEYGEFMNVPIVDRMMKNPTYLLSMCVAPLYGSEDKWLLFIELIEHYKLQGVEHFYIYIHNASAYDLKVINDYERTGEIEVHYLLERDMRNDKEWQMVHINDCVLRSRFQSKWVISADLDERLHMKSFKGTLSDFVKTVHDEKIGSIQFRQQWILKTEPMPEKYTGDSQIDKWMPSLRWHNSTGIASQSHTSKCIIDPSKVFIMWVHYVTAFYPGHSYRTHYLNAEEAVIRHYRDQRLGDWGQRWLNSTLSKFGPLRQTDYPDMFLGELTKNVKKRASYVYGNKYD